MSYPSDSRRISSAKRSTTSSISGTSDGSNSAAPGSSRSGDRSIFGQQETSNGGRAPDGRPQPNERRVHGYAQNTPELYTDPNTFSIGTFAPGNQFSELSTVDTLQPNVPAPYGWDPLPSQSRYQPPSYPPVNVHRNPQTMQDPSRRAPAPQLHQYPPDPVNGTANVGNPQYIPARAPPHPQYYSSGAASGNVGGPMQPYPQSRNSDASVHTIQGCHTEVNAQRAGGRSQRNSQSYPEENMRRSDDRSSSSAPRHRGHYK